MIKDQSCYTFSLSLTTGKVSTVNHLERKSFAKHDKLRTTLVIPLTDLEPREMEYVMEATYSSFAVIGSLICVLGGVLNGVTLATFIKHRSLLTAPNIILFSMFFSDFLMSWFAIPLTIHANLKKKWPFDESGCKVYGFLTTFCGLASINHLAGAAFERYDTLDRGTRGHNLFNKKRAVYFVLFLWICSLFFSVAPLANWSSYTVEGIGTSCSLDWSSSTPSAVSYTVVLYLGCFVVPLGIIGFSYYKLYKVVQQMRINANTVWGRLSTAAAKAMKTEKKMAFLILAMIAAFLISWTPYAVVSLISATGYKNIIGPLAASIPAYFAKSSCIYNPIIYALLFKTFRQKMFSFFPLCGRCLASGNRTGPIAIVGERIHNQEIGVEQL